MHGEDEDARAPEAAGERGAATEVVSAADYESKEESGPAVASAAELAAKNPRLAKAEFQLSVDEFDVEAWNAMIAEAQLMPLDEARSIFERLFKVFPTSSRHWRLLAEMEMNANNLDKVEALFQRCLLKCLDVDLWRVYLRYMRLVKQGQPDEQEAVASAYEFALKNVGLDMNSGSLWSEYIHLLKTAPAPTQAEIGERVARVRRAYQRAVVVPTNHVEALFRDYDRFEHDLNKELARKLLSEVHTRHLNALMAYKQKKKRAALINTTMMARPTPRNPHEQQREYQQLQLWLDLIAYEKTNPQVLDAAELRTRVVFAYKQALLTLRHYPEVWSDYAAFVAESASVEEGAKVFQQAEEALPHNLLLACMHSDFHEARHNIDEAMAVYERLASRLEEEKKRRDDELTKASDSLTPAETAARAAKNLVDPLVYIQWMMCVRRGKTVLDARKVYVRAMKAKTTSFHLHVAAAHLEYYCNSDTRVASNIFALAAKEFAGRSEFMDAYLEFLLATRDYNNMRVAIESALQALPPDERPPVWDRFVALERLVGDSESLIAAQRRRREAMPQGAPPRPEVLDVIERHSFLSLLPCSQDLALKLPRPNLALYAPLRPGMAPPPRVKGALFPDAVANVLMQLPPAHLYNGPILDAAALVEALRTRKIPADAGPAPMPAPAPSPVAAASAAHSETSLLGKRKAEAEPAEPANLYRDRQREKLARHG